MITLVLAAFLVAVPLSDRANLVGERDAKPTIQAGCTPILDAGKFPELVPDHMAWAALQQRLTKRSKQQMAGDLGVDRATVEKIDTAMARHAQGASASLDGRDDLIRSLSPSELERVEGWVQAQRRQGFYRFARTGTIVEDATKGPRCHLSVNGRENPELIPEAFYWEAYFRFKAGVAQGFVQPDGSFQAEFLRAQQMQRLRMPLEELTLVLNTAMNTLSAIERRRSLQVLTDGNDAGLVTRLAIAKIVESARADLVRLLPRASWQKVVAEAHRVRKNTLFDFPTGR